jgi:hypothetical protein
MIWSSIEDDDVGFVGSGDVGVLASGAISLPGVVSRGEVDIGEENENRETKEA